MSSSVILKASGLQTSANELDRPDGSLIEASNVIIRRDGIIEQRRGFSLYGSELPDSTDRVKQLTSYRNRIIRHFSNTLQYDLDGNGNFQPFSGSFSETQANLRMKFVESNGNLFFTTTKGIKKISARNADDFTSDSGFVVPAGALKGIDSTGKIVYVPNSQSSWFLQDSAVAYRVVWAYNDLNTNLIQGTPSQRLIVSNPMLGLLLRDYTRLLSALDNLTNTPLTEARINNKNYIETLGVTLNSSASDLQTNLSTLVTTLDNDIFYADQSNVAPLQISSAKLEEGVCTVTLTGAASDYFVAGSKIYLSGFELITQHEEQKLTFNAIPTSGQYKLKYKNIETVAINWDDSVNKTNERITFSITPTGGTFTLKYGLTASAPIAYNATPSDIQTALRLVPGLSDIVVGATGAIDSVSGLTLSSPNGITSEIIVGTNSLTSSSPVVITTELSNGIQNKLRAIDGLENIQVTGTADSVTGLTLIFPYTDGNKDEIKIGTLNTLNPATTITTSTITNGISSVSGNLNGAQIIVTPPTSINPSFTFNTTAIGKVSLSSATIKSNEYRSIVVPSFQTVEGQPSVTIGTPATNNDLVELQTYIQDILLRLTSEPISIVNSFDKTELLKIDITSACTTELNITIPQGINSNYFFQVYRSSLSQATGVATFSDVSPNDELQLVYEAYPTESEIASGFIIYKDITPDAFRGANLYTNPSTAEGISQTNDIPPLSIDVNRYRNCVFYANTRTFQSLNLNLLGVSKIISDYTNYLLDPITYSIPKICISNGSTTNTYNFVLGQKEKSTVATIAENNHSSGTLNSKYFLISSISNNYYVWFSVNNLGVDQKLTIPSLSDRIGIKINIDLNETAINVAKKTRNVLSTYLTDFIASVVDNIITIENYEVGVSKDIESGDSEFSVLRILNGRSELVQPQITQITTISGDNFKSSGSADYFTLNTTQDTNKYYIWFKRGTATDPNIPNRTGIVVNVDDVLVGSILTPKTASQVAILISESLPSEKFDTITNSNIITISNIQYGECSNAQENVLNVGFSILTKQTGALDILLSNEVSPAISVDETARSLIRIMNKNPGEIVYGYYTSYAQSVPGKMQLQSRVLENEDKFYVLGGSENIGLSFNPDIGPEGYITNIAVGDKSIITTNISHGLQTNDKVMMVSTDSTPPVDGLFSITIISPTSFSINKAVTIPGTKGSFIRASTSVYSENEERSNRVYYSKFQQPEAVPIVNYFDVGARDKKILRIMPLRNSLFVFKEDGLYRISGESAPFELELFDISFILLAPDSVAVCNNVIYAWTTQGIQSLTEGGASIISRSIDNIILKTQSANYINFRTATWGVGYESDNSYIVYTVKEEDDTFARIGYRFSVLTGTWTTYDTSHIAGIINQNDDKLYLAASDVAYIEKERKTFSRLDYTDREIKTNLITNKIFTNSMILPSISNVSIGDVIVQNQTITTTNFNILLNKLDSDSGIGDSNYFSILELKKGEAPRQPLLNLATKLNSDLKSTGLILNNTIGNPTIITSTLHGLSNNRIIKISGSSILSMNNIYTVTIINENQFSIPFNALSSAGISGSWETWDNEYYKNIENKSGIITSCSVSNSTIITSENHQLISGRIVLIDGSNSTPSIDGEYMVTIIDDNTFSIPASVKILGNSGNWQTVNDDFLDLKACYNKIITTLNLDPKVAFNNYSQITYETLMETIIVDVNTITRKIITNLALDFLIGDAVIYKAFKSSFAYSPITFADPLSLKHIREATIMFETRALTGGILSFRTDLLPEFIDVPFKLEGNGIFGHTDGFGDGFFGGIGNSAPFRTYIPRQCQRCRYMIVKFSHSTAREDFRINGCTLTGETNISTRAYR